MRDRHNKPEFSSPLAPVDDRSVESITLLLGQWRDGDDAAFAEVVNRLYSELRRLAGSYLRGEGSQSTIGPTAVVHEFFLKAQALRGVEWESRGQFIAAAARAMRNLLVDHARRRLSQKRGGDRVESLWNQEGAVDEADTGVLALNEALDRLAVDHPRNARIVELMFFGGLNAEEAAEAVGISQRTAERDWRFARAWLAVRMGAGRDA